MRKSPGVLATTGLVVGMIASLLVTSSVNAHAIWFAQRATQLALIYGLGADDLDSVKRLPDLQDISGYDTDWNKVPTDLRVAGPLVLVDSDYQPAVVAAVLDYGIWTKTQDGHWLRKAKDEVENPVVSSRSFKYAVHIAEPLTSPLPALEHHTLQVVPVSASLPDLIGQPMELRVLYHGEPVAGAAVKVDWVNDPDAQPYITDADGSVVIRVRNQGLNVIAAIYEVPEENPIKYDRAKHNATLSFVLPHEPE